MLSPIHNMRFQTNALAWYMFFTIPWDEYNTIPFISFLSFHIYLDVIGYIKSFNKRARAI
ncbi:hypothetical protein DRN34_01480 [Thermococci archaeon]|nr:MAG: hypothetical protein DRN34_01480 [Thermococci archaeon]